MSRKRRRWGESLAPNMPRALRAPPQRSPHVRPQAQWRATLWLGIGMPPSFETPAAPQDEVCVLLSRLLQPRLTCNDLILRRRRRRRLEGWNPARPLHAHIGSMPFEDQIQAIPGQIIEFVRANEVWAAPVVGALAFGESLAFISLLAAGLGDPGRDRRPDRAERHQFLADLGGGRARGGARRLAVLLGRRQGRAGGRPGVAVVAPPRSHSARRTLCRPGGDHSASSSAGSPARCAPRCPWWPAFSPCRIGTSRPPISCPPSCGSRCFSPWGMSRR